MDIFPEFDRTNQDKDYESAMADPTFDGIDERHQEDRVSSTSSLPAGAVLFQDTPSIEPAGNVVMNFDPGKAEKRDYVVTIDDVFQNTRDDKEDDITESIKHFYMCGPEEGSRNDVVDADVGSEGDVSMQGAHPPEIRLLERIDSEYQYNMRHQERGCFIIFNQKNFDPKLRLKVRLGTDMDAMNIEDTVKNLGFEYVRIIHDASKQLIQRWLKRVAEADHSNYDCFGCAILTHGGDNDVLYARDAKMELKEFTRPFSPDNCPSLARKPKLFFIQACRGYKRDDGVQVRLASNSFDRVDGPAGAPVGDVVDGAPDYVSVPVEADFLIANSTVSEYYSWRNENNGSIFIQNLCATLRKYGAHMEIMQMMTRVNRLVAYDFESATDDPTWNKKKQIPSVSTRLTAELFFHPKPNQASRPPQVEPPSYLASRQSYASPNASGDQRLSFSPGYNTGDPHKPEHVNPQKPDDVMERRSAIDNSNRLPSLPWAIPGGPRKSSLQVNPPYSNSADAVRRMHKSDTEPSNMTHLFAKGRNSDRRSLPPNTSQILASSEDLSVAGLSVKKFYYETPI
ncbi:uncharacterized protein LOC143470121 [Clavelina lepadiformis]|uniref:uncharacterized protein LOC143470121 n=1 Tax=Clavelina lepadiformis TaxID=159417 RepID=UPI0040428CE7